MCVMLSPETLRRFPFFAGLDAAALTTLAIEGEEVTIQKGDWLFYAGDAADALYIVVSGSIKDTFGQTLGEDKQLTFKVGSVTNLRSRLVTIPASFLPRRTGTPEIL